MSRSWWGLVGLVVACHGGGGSKVPGGTGTPAGGPTSGTTSAPSFDCATDVPTLPLPTPQRIFGFTNAEDFAFDAEGRYVATDEFGNLVRITFEGDVEMWVPELGVTAGTVFLPDGSLAIANVDRGQVQRVYENGSTERLIGALSYPNGVTVDKNGVVYVADQNLGEVIAYDPATDDRRVIARDLFNPNGLALGPGHETLYVGSFGGGTVHAIDLVGGGDPVLFGTTPTGTTTTGGTDDACVGLSEGDECFQDLGLGECDAGGTCALALDEAACAGKVAGEACVTDTLGLPNSSVCAEHPSGVLFCPEVPAEVVEACVGLSEDDPCSAMGIDRNCRDSWEGILVCDITPWTETAYAACDGLSVNDACVVLDVEAYTAGTCLQDPYGYGVVCTPDWGGYGGYTFHGGLDGIGVDACGYVWVTEYTLGYVWRFPPQGGQPELAVETGTFWIPNMHWGNGVGGWDEQVMYMQDRSTDDLLVIPIGLPVAQPEP